MSCKECYWCKQEIPLGSERVCCNKNSENYNKIFPEEEASERNCELAETKQAVDYREMTAWEFAVKYYM